MGIESFNQEAGPLNNNERSEEIAKAVEFIMSAEPEGGGDEESGRIGLLDSFIQTGAISQELRDSIAKEISRRIREGN